MITLNETQGFLYLGHSNWTIFNLLSQTCSPTLPTFNFTILVGAPISFYIPQSGSVENEKEVFTQKWMINKGCTQAQIFPTSSIPHLYTRAH